MNTTKFERLGSAIAATVRIAAFSGFAVLPARAQTHSHHATVPANTNLNQGHQWATDDALRSGRAEICQLVKPKIAPFWLANSA